MLIKLSTWSCVEIRMQDEVIILRSITSFERVEEFKIWVQPLQIKILFKKKLRAD
jgi:hypothetical protein